MLEHMLADRQSNVSSLRSLGHDLESVDLDPTQQRDLQTSLDECMDRYNTVSDVCVQHRSELGRIESAVSRYWTKLDTLLSWLDVTERSAIMMDVISADVSAVQQQAIQQQVSSCTSTWTAGTVVVVLSSSAVLFLLSHTVYNLWELLIESSFYHY